jgi:hypothetical protein
MTKIVKSAPVDPGETPCTHLSENYRLLGVNSTGKAEITFCPECRTRNRATGKLMQGRLISILYDDIESLSPFSFHRVLTLTEKSVILQ